MKLRLIISKLVIISTLLSSCSNKDNEDINSLSNTRSCIEASAYSNCKKAIGFHVFCDSSRTQNEIETIKIISNLEDSSSYHYMRFNEGDLVYIESYKKNLRQNDIIVNELKYYSWIYPNVIPDTLLALAPSKAISFLSKCASCHNFQKEYSKICKYTSDRSQKKKEFISKFMSTQKHEYVSVAKKELYEIYEFIREMECHESEIIAISQ
jgi:hypothetical protein